MAAFAQIKEMVQAAVDAVTGRYDARLDDLEKRVADLEAAAPPAAKKAAAPARKTAPAVKAQAGTAHVKGEATGP